MGIVFFSNTFDIWNLLAEKAVKSDTIIMFNGHLDGHLNRHGIRLNGSKLN